MSFQNVPPKIDRESTTMNIRLSDAVVLLTNVLIAEQKSQIGFEDANRTISELFNELVGTKMVNVPVSAVESALWSANLLDERGAFVHFRPISFKTFVGNVAGPGNFSFLHNYIKEKK